MPQLKRRTTAITGLILVGVAAAATTIMRCDAAALNTSFSYIPRERPRVFISHHPLRALPGQSVTIRLAPDLRPEHGSAQSATARIKVDGTTAFTPLSCTAEPDGTFACPHVLPGGAANYVYDGEVNWPGGSIKSRSYRFRAVTSIGASAIALREPVAPNARLAEASFRVRTVWIRDPGDGYDDATFRTDVESAVYDAILKDPVYRWRDAQLAFYEHGAAGITTSYYAGFDTRCGQNPWPESAQLPPGLGSMQVMAVVHRHPNTAGGTEGAVTSTNSFRDCAGTAVRNQDISTFSAAGTLPDVAKHEFGHAAFGLGDEYTESEDTRRAPPGGAPTNQDCCCMRDTGGFGTGTGGGGSGAGIGAGFSPRALIPVCASSDFNAVGSLVLSTCSTEPPTFPSTCYAQPVEACPPFESRCIVDRMWLGPPAAAALARGNVFPSLQACQDARAAALTHPGVEDASASVETECRRLCGGDIPCACGPSEAWIVDKTAGAPPVTAGSSTDTMGVVSADRHGATCQWCVDTSLCVRWERSRGQTADQTWNYCQAPPIDAASQERSWTAYLQAVFDDIARYVRF
jgi:hypothetical protein